jgi:GT2 family glycosyltransferase/glycosyltransferase involved in cell wall biosynthesis
MALRDVRPGDRLDVRRGEAVVCIPVYGARESFLECLTSVVRHTEAQTPILICDDATPDADLRAPIDSLLRNRDRPNVYYMRQTENVGFVKTVNAAMAATDPADVVVLNSDCVVGEGWLFSLRDAACSDARVATATALTNAGTIVSIPERNAPTPTLPEGWSADRMAEAVRAASLRLRPDLPTCVGHCVYIRRSAIDLVGLFDTAFSPGYEEEVDFSQRCVLRGLRHVLADDVFVLHRGAQSFGAGEDAARLRVDHHAIITQRYPYFDRWREAIARDEDSPLARALSVAARAIRPLTVTIDGRILRDSAVGSQVTALQTISALDAFTDCDLRVLVPEDVSEAVQDFLRRRPWIALITPTDLVRGVERTDIVHRPYQASSFDDLDVLRALGHRIVLTHLDSIALRNPGYFPSFDDWTGYWRLNLCALAAADRVIFLTKDAAADASALGIVNKERASVVAQDVEPTELNADRPSNRPPQTERLRERSFLLCLGTDFLHKNRIFAIRLLEALLEANTFDGDLVLAGPRMMWGTSADEEESYLLSRPTLVERITDLGTVDEATKAWLLHQAAAVVYPTTHEGFGLIPFEAARAGTPCLFASHTSLAETLPAEAALIQPWNATKSARRAAPVLVPGRPRDELVRTILDAGARFTRRAHAEGLEQVYHAALRSPPTETFWCAVAELQREVDLLRDKLRSLESDSLEFDRKPLRRPLRESLDQLAQHHRQVPYVIRRTAAAVRLAADRIRSIPGGIADQATPAQRPVRSPEQRSRPDGSTSDNP